LLRVEKHVGILDPVNILKRGFSITLHNGKAVKNKDEVKDGETITTILADGIIESVATGTIKSNDND
jgi:exodeoxyribonuclease VII large subunit